MPHLEESVALATCERALRQLLVFVLQREHGADWLMKVSTSKQRASWAFAKDNDHDARTRRGAVDVPGGPLDYSLFREVVGIAAKVWDPLLVDALGKREETLPLLERMAQLRNPIGHSRELLPFEQDLISGIAGDIRNRVTIYMSGTDPQGDHYPRIESVTDSFGNTVPFVEHGREKEWLFTHMRLNYGDEVTFACRGTDPQGRELTWSFMGQHASGKSVNATGNEVNLRYVFDQPGDVGESVSVIVLMRSPGPFHRNGVWDGTARFEYEVLPPDPSSMPPEEEPEPEKPYETHVREVVETAVSELQALGTARQPWWKRLFG